MIRKLKSGEYRLYSRKKNPKTGKLYQLSDLNVSVRLSGTEALKNFVVADDCIGFLPMRSVAKELISGSLVRLYVEDLLITRQFYFIQRHGDEGDGLSSAFIKFAKTHYNLK